MSFNKKQIDNDNLIAMYLILLTIYLKNTIKNFSLAHGLMCPVHVQGVIISNHTVTRFFISCICKYLNNYCYRCCCFYFHE